MKVFDRKIKEENLQKYILLNTEPNKSKSNCKNKSHKFVIKELLKVLDNLSKVARILSTNVPDNFDDVLLSRLLVSLIVSFKF